MKLEEVCEMQVEVFVENVMVDLKSGQTIVILVSKGDNDDVMAIWISEEIAMSIALSLANISNTRPLTHDLMKTIIEISDARIAKAVITKIENNTYFASIFLIKKSGEEIEIDARPGDAIALAVRLNTPIFVESALLQKMPKQLPPPDTNSDTVYGMSKIPLDKLDRKRCRRHSAKLFHRMVIA